MLRPLATVLAVSALVTATACGTQGGSTDLTPAAHLEADGAMAPVADDVSYAGLSDGMRTLGQDLALELTSDDGNLIYSPASMAIAFAMLREGAKGATAEEIDRVLHLPADRQTAYNGLLHALAEPGDGDTLDVNDGIFLADGFPVDPGFLEALKTWYDAGVEQTTFPDPGVADINSWVDEGTHGRIPKLFDDLDPATVMVLVNTIYLNAKWEQPFDVSVTAPAPFTTGAGTEVTAETMHLTASLDYAEGDGWQAVRLPYGGGKLSMWVLLPGGGGDPRELITASSLDAVGDQFASRDVAVSLPRWDTENSVDLIETLKALGMTNTFGPSADFGGLTPDPSFAISQVVQQANITVGEKGTEAAAATAIVGDTTAIEPPDDLVEFDADHPFAFVVMHDETGVPLFEGVVADPS